MDNQYNLNVAQGARIQSAETVARSRARSLVTGHGGPKAFRVPASAGINIFNTDAPTVAAALEQDRTARLTGAKAADVEGHWA